MPTIHEYRREHLRRLIGENGGPTILGKRLGYANGTFLVQMAGPAPMTEVSENTARSFEKKLNLPDRYFDQPVEPRVSGEVVTGRSTKKHSLAATAKPVVNLAATPFENLSISDEAHFTGNDTLNGTDMLCGGNDTLIGGLSNAPRQRMNYGPNAAVQELSVFPQGSFQTGVTATPQVGLSELGKFIKIVGQLCADEKIDLPAKKFADVIALSLVDAEKNHGVPQLDYAKGLLELLKN